MKKTMVVLLIISAMLLVVSCASTKQQAPKQVAPLTEGVFIRRVSETRNILFKFYEDGTFYAQGIMGGAKRGTYVVRDKHIAYYDCEEDGTAINAELDRKAFVKLGEKGIYFYEEDGMTTMPMYVDDPAYPEYSKFKVNGVDTNAIAYANDCLYNVYMEGTRTLEHDPSREFTIDDEIEITRYHFMLNDSDHSITITQKKFTSTLFGKEVVGSYTRNGNSYELLDSEGNVYGTMTVSDNENPAVFTKEGHDLELVPYEEAVDESILKTLKFTGEDGFVMDISLNFRKDKTFDIIGLVSGQVRLSITGNWDLGSMEKPLVFSNLSNGKINVTVGDDIKISWAGVISDSGITGNAIFSMPKAEIMDLRLPEKTTVLAFGASMMDGRMVFDIVLYSDKSVSLIGNGKEIAQGAWTDYKGIPASITLDNNASVAIDLSTPSNPILKYNGTIGLGDRTAEIEFLKK